MDKIKKEINQDQFEKACENYFNAAKKRENMSTLKKLFQEMILYLKKEGGLLQLFPTEIYIYNDIVDLLKAEKVLSQELFKLVLSLSTQLEGNNIYVCNENNAPYINYEMYEQECTNIALNFVMLTGTTAFVNQKYLQGLEKKLFNRDLEYIENSSKLVQDKMVYSSQWRILFRHYKKEVYNLYTEECIGDLEFADREDYQEIIHDMFSKSSSMNKKEIEKLTYEYITKYGLDNYYPFS